MPEIRTRATPLYMSRCVFGQDPGLSRNIRLACIRLWVLTELVAVYPGVLIGQTPDLGAAGAERGRVGRVCRRLPPGWPGVGGQVRQATWCTSPQGTPSAEWCRRMASSS